jgi:hypothetical protein
MGWLENGEKNLKKEQPEQRIIKHKNTLFKCGLLKGIEKVRLGRESVQKLDLYPRSAYESNRDSQHFLKELTYLHTQYFVRHSACYSSFCIAVKADGIYWESGGNIKKLSNPFTVTDQEIREWFALLEKK